MSFLEVSRAIGADLRLNVVAGIGSIVVAACASGGRGVAPAIASISPASGPAGTAYPVELTITGSNFADTANTVTFGPVTITSVKSTNGGTRIVLFAPKQMPSTGEVAPMPLMAGEYAVRVAVKGAASNAVMFNLTREP